MKRLLTIAMAAFAVLTLAACDISTAAPTARQTEAATATANQAALNTAIPIPQVKFAQERHNLKRRSDIINVQNLSGCVMLFTPNGQLVGKFVTDGKVSSLNSYMLASDQIVDDPFDGFDNRAGVVIEQADIDGAYGSNADGVFFIDAGTGALIEWTGPHFWSNQCLDTNVQPLVVSTVAPE